eukprot:14826692-Alexandrium_andersonii.AAC.1
MCCHPLILGQLLPTSARVWEGAGDGAGHPTRARAREGGIRTCEAGEFGRRQKDKIRRSTVLSLIHI